MRTIKRSQNHSKLAFLGNFPPRQCGIATFTHDLRAAVASQISPQSECAVIAVNDHTASYDYPEEVWFEIAEQDLRDYRLAGEFLHLNGFEVLCVQHEFGIFGGKAGSHVLSLLRTLEIPVVTTLHTVLEQPDPDQLRVMKELSLLSSLLVVMSERGVRMLGDIYGVPEEKIRLIPHGIPDIPFADPNFFKDEFGMAGKKTLLTFGLLSPGKGIENVIRALPAIVSKVPELVYIVLGATHPQLVRQEGEAYRLSLKHLTRQLGVEQHVAFYDRFVEPDELTEFISAADIYLTPYPHREQITSGTLCYAFGCGKAVISTPYWHAEELLADGQGILVPFEDSESIARAALELLLDDTKRHAMRKSAYLAGRHSVWSSVGQQYLTAFRDARVHAARPAVRRYTVETLEKKWTELPETNHDHLERLTDSTGVLQHASYSMPDFNEGYCADDNARALLLTALLEEVGEDPQTLRRETTVYTAFLNYAFHRESGRFRNFMSYDRRWLEEVGSDDSHGRCLWALGACVSHSRYKSLHKWATELFALALPAMDAITSPRAWAFALLGIEEYLGRFEGDRHIAHFRDTLTSRLLDLHRRQSTDDWPWFEPVLSYSNATLSHALIASGRQSHDEQALRTGLESLRWLAHQQTAPEGWFRPIGSNGFFPRGGNRARFDQQPIEAHAMVAAAVEAFEATRDRSWLDEAHRAFEWFFGRNDLGQSLYNPTSGGCHDGLHFDRVNFNQGAESTLAFLLALREMRLLETTTLDTLEPPRGADSKKRINSSPVPMTSPALHESSTA